MFVCVCGERVMKRENKQELLLKERKTEKSRARWQADDTGDVWWHLISLITDMHPGKSTDAQIQNRGGSSGGGWGDSETERGKHTHPNTGYISAPLFPEPSYPEVISAILARNFPLRICFAHFMTVIFLPIPRKISFMINSCSCVS